MEGNNSLIPCAFGFVLPLNGLLERAAPQTVSGVVTEKDTGGLGIEYYTYAD